MYDIAFHPDLMRAFMGVIQQFLDEITDQPREPFDLTKMNYGPVSTLHGIVTITLRLPWMRHLRSNIVERKNVKLQIKSMLKKRKDELPYLNLGDTKPRAMPKASDTPRRSLAKCLD